MAFHWQSKVNVQHVGVDDMVLIPKLTEQSIVENLKKRLQANSIFTYIGPVLISVNPFKQMPYFTEKEMLLYQGAAQYENAPHIYALADNMYRNMLIDNESQCVIISGESGAGKTVNAKFIMNYISRISGGGQKVQHIKDVILQSNPLLEAFGNSATVRNWNSSRFGKYVEIVFSRGGEPIGGKLSNFLLEKSRVVHQNEGDRNFHIFYQLCAGADKNLKSSLGIGDLQYYNYLNMSGVFKADDTDDGKEFESTLHAMKVVGVNEQDQLEVLRIVSHAMKVVGVNEQDQLEVLRIVSAVLHIGNISFSEENNFAAVSGKDYLEFPAFLLGLTNGDIEAKLTGRKMESKWGTQKEEIDMKLNVEQANYTRDAWVKAIYARLFDYLVKKVNDAMNITSQSSSDNFSIGILDIYGFEIFNNNGFEQFCINFVNEKLQQIFIELTLKAEQEEYVREGIKWTEIDYFDNKIVCDLIETKRPPGIMSLLDDTCAQNHGQRDGVDRQLLTTLSKSFAGHAHFAPGSDSFLIKHYAGDVTYNVDGFCDRNRDVLYPDLILLMQKSSNTFIRSLFPENVAASAGKRPTTFSTKIRVSLNWIFISYKFQLQTQANTLVESLMKCSPHYVRCIKPNETKRPNDWDESRVKHQVEYLGLRENIRVRRAGFAYRRAFDKFAQRYAIVSPQTWPSFHGDQQKACEIICDSVHMEKSQYQMGRTKIFVKNPESVRLCFKLKQDNNLVSVVLARRDTRTEQKEQAADLMYGKKERRRYSLNRNFVGDYIGLEHHPTLQSLVGKRQRVLFACTANKYDRKFRVCQTYKTTQTFIEMVTGELSLFEMKVFKSHTSIFRQLDLPQIKSIGLSPYQDDFVIINVGGEEYTSLLETPFKTEFCTALSKAYKERTNGNLHLDFRNSHIVSYKKMKFDFSDGKRTVQFGSDGTSSAEKTLKPNGKVLNVSIGAGLPNTTRPSTERPQGGYTPRRDQLRTSTRRTNKNTYNGTQATRAAPVSYHNTINIFQVPSHGTNNNYNQQPSHASVPTPVSTNHQYSQEPARIPVMGNVINQLNNMNMAASGNSNPSAGRGPPPARGPKPPPPAKPKLNPVVIAVYPYEAQDVDELSFEAGDEIELMNKDASGWWQGKINNRVGLFPGNYVKE
ncbi:hypothetical protein CAEBREN_31713 [Caenorhabditis brenneri]|uniref:Uncharacterized protein n=1 Tax=Caenorhabditis brenneri TaxID=135651 RepID=G0NUV5_CAEBE|nr:hypothetical protein CAEBREN_31713 [Caenorhabditis brenneri]